MKSNRYKGKFKNKEKQVKLLNRKFIDGNGKIIRENNANKNN